MPKVGDKPREAWAIHNARAEEILPALPSGSVDFVMTDPPYGHNNNSNGDLIHRREAALGKGQIGEARAIPNDGAETDELVRWAFAEFARLLKPGCCCCCCGGGGGPDPQFARWSLWLDEAVGFKQMVVWDKGPIGMGWHYRRSYETILVAQKPGVAARWFDTTMAVENVIRFHGNVRKIIPGPDEHPCAKPVALAEHFLRLHTRPGDMVLDPFMGHGWVGEACMRLGRRFVGVELDRGFFDEARRRIDLAHGIGPVGCPEMIREPPWEAIRDA